MIRFAAGQNEALKRFLVPMAPARTVAFGT
jgi:hypothetical protein